MSAFRFVVLEGPSRGSVHELGPEPARIGRDPAAEVSLPDDRVSRLHAEVHPTADGTGRVLRDLGSRNGTWLNGARCEEAALAPGDEVRVGDSVLLWAGPAATAPMAAEHAKPGRTTVGVADPAAQPVPVPPAPVTLPRGLTPTATCLLGDGPAMREVHRAVFRVAPLDVNVLVTGESGTGKELVAEAIHRNSPRRQGPFLALNGAVLQGELLESELFGHERGAYTGAAARRLGAFELARGGTLFLDEVGELAPATQAALLRVIEGKGFRRLGGSEAILPDVRLVAATNRDLSALVREGAFREDLYYRLARVRIELPPLRDRPGDVRLLAQHFLSELRARTGTPAERFSEEALRNLESHAWPGNVRELRNAVERVAIFCECAEVRPEDLPPELRAARSGGGKETAAGTVGGSAFPALHELEAAHVKAALARTGGNKTRAAKLLGIDRATLYAKLQKYGLEGGA